MLRRKRVVVEALRIGRALGCARPDDGGVLRHGEGVSWRSQHEGCRERARLPNWPTVGSSAQCVWYLGDELRNGAQYSPNRGIPARESVTDPQPPRSRQRTRSADAWSRKRWRLGAVAGVAASAAVVVLKSMGTPDSEVEADLENEKTLATV